jgi:hypothetical protein
MLTDQSLHLAIKRGEKPNGGEDELEGTRGLLNGGRGGSSHSLSRLVRRIFFLAEQVLAFNRINASRIQAPIDLHRAKGNKIKR